MTGLKGTAQTLFLEILKVNEEAQHQYYRIKKVFLGLVKA
jgi:hypothetical protein